MADITVLGDSHSGFFQEVPNYAGRLGLSWPLPYRIDGEAIRAATVAGFRRPNATMRAREKIRAHLGTAQRLVLAFGQVDIELGYYHRLAVKKEDVTPDGYVAWLLDIYDAFLADLPFGTVPVALKGLNLTALAPQPFAVRYVSRIVTEGTDVGREAAARLVAPHILSEAAQNAMHLAFNAGLAQLAAARGMRYFDLVQETGVPAEPGRPEAPLRLDDIYRTAKFDHHIADTVAVRRMHYVAAGRVFGLI